MKFKSYEDGEVLQKEGSPISKVMIVISGNTKYGSEEFEKGSAFNSEFLKPDSNLEKPLEHDFVTDGKSTIAYISLKKFHSIIGGTLSKILEKNKNSHEVNFFC